MAALLVAVAAKHTVQPVRLEGRWSASAAFYAASDSVCTARKAEPDRVVALVGSCHAVVKQTHEEVHIAAEDGMHALVAQAIPLDADTAVCNALVLIAEDALQAGFGRQ